jgi:hypothetical protein
VEEHPGSTYDKGSKIFLEDFKPHFCWAFETRHECENVQFYKAKRLTGDNLNNNTLSH